jgi:hypothetical protein
MALQLGNLRDALKEAGASDEMAKKAAEEVAAYENRLVAIEQQLAALRSYVDLQFAAIRSDICLLQWITGTILIFQIAIFLKLFIHG